MCLLQDGIKQIWICGYTKNSKCLTLIVPPPNQPPTVDAEAPNTVRLVLHFLTTSNHQRVRPRPRKCSNFPQTIDVDHRNRDLNYLKLSIFFINIQPGFGLHTATTGDVGSNLERIVFSSSFFFSSVPSLFSFGRWGQQWRMYSNH